MLGRYLRLLSCNGGETPPARNILVKKRYSTCFVERLSGCVAFLWWSNAKKSDVFFLCVTNSPRFVRTWYECHDGSKRLLLYLRYSPRKCFSRPELSLGTACVIPLPGSLGYLVYPDAVRNPSAWATSCATILYVVNMFRLMLPLKR